LLIIAGVAVASVGTAALIRAQAAPDRSWWSPVVVGIWLLVLLAVCGVLVSANIRAIGRSASYQRATRFVLTDNAFMIPPLVSPGTTVMMPMMISGFFVAIGTQKWHELNDPERASSTLEFIGVAVVVLLLTLPTAFLAALAWQGSTVALTPDGVRWRGPLFRRLVPWQALATGGPPHPGPRATKLELVVTQPDLVIQRGWAARFGRRRQPALALQVAVHPGFLADAIRWYVEHPADRVAIGTQTEHDRLVAELTAGTQTQAQTDVPRLPRPQTVEIAVALTYAGAALGLLAAAADLVIAIVFRAQLRAVEQATAAEAALHSDEAAGTPMLDDADFAKAWAIGSLVLVVIAGGIAVILARAAWRGTYLARTGLIVMSGLAAAWAICPCGPPTLSLTGAPKPDSLTSNVVLLWMAERGLILVLAVTVLVLLVLPTSTWYFRPPAAAR
jgi:hypothetical protein